MAEVIELASEQPAGEEEEEPNSSNHFELADSFVADSRDEASIHSTPGVTPVRPGFFRLTTLALRNYYTRLTTQPPPNSDDDEADDNIEQQANDNDIAVDTQRPKVSLARAATTPRICLLLVPLLCLVSHVIFYIGQTSPMWKLTLAANNISVWANATSKTSRYAFDALNLHDQNHYTMDHNTTVQSFTYGFSVKEMWEAKGMPGTFLPRMAAVLLVLFSGVWPHLKLILLQTTWWSRGYSERPQARTRTLGWLALFGKWSLADVLTVCVMVGVLNLEWDIDPPVIKEGIMNHLQTILHLVQLVYTDAQLCSKFLKFDASNCGSGKLSIMQKLKCRTCKSFVDEAFYRPGAVDKTGRAIMKDIATSGGGIVRLSVQGLHGIYFFCAAICLSILLSVLVEWYNKKYIESLRKEHRRLYSMSSTHSLLLTDDETPPPPPSMEDSVLSEPLLDPTEQSQDQDDPTGFQPMELMQDDHSIFSSIIHRTTQSRTYQCFQCHYIVPIVTLIFVVLAIYLPSMKRRVEGAIPLLLKDILGIHLDKVYSLDTLRQTCGAAGGMDLFLMATFGLFIVVGPLVRAVLVVAAAMTKPEGESTKRIRSILVSTANFLAAFCAWEVFFPALVMVELIMPSTTATILNTDFCHVISGDGSSCLIVGFENVPSTFACLIGGFLLVGGLAIRVSTDEKNERLIAETNHRIDGTGDTGSLTVRELIENNTDGGDVIVRV